MEKLTTKISVQEKEISFLNQESGEFISLTDMAKYRNADEPFSIINNWMRSRNTIEFIGLWEKLNNPDFKPTDFDRFKNESGSNYFVLSPQRWILTTNAIGIISKHWREANPDKEGNIRDFATLEQLVVLSNLESINALLIGQGLTQSTRLLQLNKVAIAQMKSLVESNSMKRLSKGK